MSSFPKGRTIVLLFLAMAILIVLAMPVVGQERSGNVTGVVRDSSGAVLPGVSVTLKNKETNRTSSTKTRGDGSFTVPEVEPGHYSVLFEKNGFSRQELADVPVLVGKSSNIDVAMKVGAVAEVVEVSGAAPAIDTTSTMIAHNVTSEEINTLPKGRDFTGVAVFSPSVNTGYVDGGYQINGASGAENAYYVDGVSTNSMIDGSARQTATFDYLQEVQVKTTGLEAEYGGALGGVVSAVTKSGGNTFHGDAHFYYFGNKLNAGPGQRMQINPTTRDAFQYFQDDAGKSDNFEPGGSLGGPILKDKLWFYSLFSPRWTEQKRLIHFSDGDATFGRRYSKMNWFSKISFDPTSRIRMNFTYLYTPETMNGGGMATYNAFAPNSSVSTIATAKKNDPLGYFQPETSYTGEVTYTPTNSTVISVKGGRYWLDYKDTGVTELAQWSWATNSFLFPTAPQFDSGYLTPPAAAIYHDLTTRSYVQADISQFVRFAGQHNFKFGVGTAKNVNNVNNDWFGVNGLVTLYWNYLDADGNLQVQSCKGCVGTGTGTYGYYTVETGGTIGTAGSSINHFYVQDSWKIFNRLTINAGVRFEHEVIPSFQPKVKPFAFMFGWGDKIAPRLAAAFDLFGNGKVKISGGWGRFYDWTKFDLARGTFGADVWHVRYRTLDTLDPLSIDANNMPGTNLWPADFRDYRKPGFQYLDSNIKPMSTDSMNAGIEWELKKDMVFTGRYVRTKLNRTIEDMGALDATGSEVYRYGNPGEGANVYEPSSGTSCPAQVAGTCAVLMPKPKRVYDAMELSLSRRFGAGYQFTASYVYSRLWGNYSGLQSTDEIRPSTLGGIFAGNQGYFGQNYRPGGNANRYYDLDQAFFDAHGNDGLYGVLPTDRPHVFKFYGSKQFKFGTEIGGFFRLSSGTPVTTQVVSSAPIPMYVEGRGNLGRTPVFSQTDLMVAHEFKVSKDETKRLRFEFNMINLFNQKTNVFTFDRYNQEELSDSVGLDMSTVDLTKGFDWKSMVAANGGLDPRYGKAAAFNPGFQGRFLVKFIF